MRTGKPLKSVEKKIASVDFIDEYHIEDDYMEGDASPFSYWIYLKPGYINKLTDTHAIHESSAREVLQAFNFVEPCDCDDCKANLNQE